MSYKIEYVPQKKHRLRFAMLILGFFLLFAYSVLGGDRLEAFEELAQQLGAGAQIGEAVESFCQDVIYGS